MQSKLSINLIIIFILSIQAVLGQITPLTTNVTNEISVVRTNGSSLVLAANSGNILKSIDNGNTFSIYPIVDAQNNAIPLAAIYDFQFISPSVIIAVGTASFGQNEIILRSTNTGANWTITYQNSTGTWPRILNNVDFSTSLIGVCVGTNGRLLRTINGGISWTTLNSSTTNELADIAFNSINQAVIVGDGIKMNSTNSGQSWNMVSTNSNFSNCVNLLNNSVGYALGDSHTFSKTSDGGATWNDNNLNVTGSLVVPEMTFTSETEGYFIGNDNKFYHTTTGGQYWNYLDLGFEPTSMSVSPWNDIYVSGTLGEMVKINPSTYFHPIASFYLNSNVFCYNQISTVNNQSDPNLTTNWLVDGISVSQDYNLSYLANTPSQNHILTLVVSDGISTDSTSATFFVNQGNEFALNVNVSAPIICSNGSSTISVTNSNQIISYQLYKNSVPVGLPVSGNNSTLNFQTGALQSTTEFCITATLNTLGCLPTSHSWCGTITIQNPSPTTLTSLVQDTICPNSSTQLVVFNSQPSVTYSMYIGNAQQGTSQLGNNQNLYFNLPSTNQNTAVYIKGVSAIGCVTNYNAQPVVVQNPDVHWTSANFSSFVNEPISLINTTQTEGSFEWNFDNSASTITSNLFEPNFVSFTTGGNHNVTLTHTTPLGCIQSVSRTFRIVEGFEAETCESIRIIDQSSPLMASSPWEIIRDHSDNIIEVSQLSANLNSYTTSDHGDSLSTFQALSGQSHFKTWIIKYSADGRPMWSTCLESKDAITHSSITTDSNNNIFLLFEATTDQDTIKIFSSDKRKIAWRPNQSFVTIKFDSNGIYQWKKQVNNPINPTYDMVFIKTDNENNLYVNTSFLTYKYNSNGDLIYSVQAEIADILPDNMGGFFGLLSDFPRINHYDAQGILIQQSPVIYKTDGSVAIVAELQLRGDDEHNLYAVGAFANQMVFGIDTLVSTYSSGFSILKFNSNLMPTWSNTMTSSAQIFLKGFDVQNNNVVLAALGSGIPVNLNGDSIYTFANNYHYFLYRCDSIGNNSDIKSMFNINPISTITSQLSNLVLTDDGSRFNFQFSYASPISFFNGAQFLTNNQSGYKYIGITNFDIACLFDAQSPNLPIAYFESPIKSCQNVPINLTNLSQNAESYSWTFQGANILNSQEENPQVTFNSPGIHVVTLTCTGANGLTNTFNSYVQVLEPISVTHSYPAHICQGDDFAIEFTHNATSVVPSLEYNVIKTIYNIQSDSTIYFTFSNSACTYIDTINIDINIPLPLTFSGDFPDTLCSGSPAIPLPTPSVPGGSFTTNYGSILNGYLSPSDVGNNEITYTYFDQNTNCHYYHKDTLVIVHNDIFTTFNTNSPSYCSDTLTLRIYPQGWVEQSTWNFNSGTVLSQGLDSCVIILPPNGYFHYNVTLSNPYCTYTSENDSFIIKPVPAVTFNPFLEDTICSNSPPIEVISGQPSGGTYQDQQEAMTVINNIRYINPALLNPNLTDTLYYYYTGTNGCTNMALNTITAIICEDMENLSYDKPVVYMSANNNELNIQNLTGESLIQIFDISGRMILSETSYSVATKYTLEKVSNAMYIVKINSNKHSSQYKIISY